MSVEVRNREEEKIDGRSRRLFFYFLGLLLQLLLVLTDELESKIYAFGARTDENVQDIQMKIKTLGAVEKRK